MTTQELTKVCQAAWEAASGKPMQGWEAEDLASIIGHLVANSAAGVCGPAELHEHFFGKKTGEGWHPGPLVHDGVKQHAWLVDFASLKPAQQSYYRMIFALVGVFG
jgi:hypothetical protein